MMCPSGYQHRRRPACRRSGATSVTRLSKNVGFEISISFEEFGWSMLEREASEEGLRLDRLVSLACAYYKSELANERMATLVPRFDQLAAERETRTLELELDAESLRRLEQEAERQEVKLERLIEYAAIFYLADLDAGRVAERVIGPAGA